MYIYIHTLYIYLFTLYFLHCSFTYVVISIHLPQLNSIIHPDQSLIHLLFTYTTLVYAYMFVCACVYLCLSSQIYKWIWANFLADHEPKWQQTVFFSVPAAQRRWILNVTRDEIHCRVFATKIRSCLPELSLALSLIVRKHFKYTVCGRANPTTQSAL